ncbi:ABC transporter permease [Thermus islandicus]|uniref:ABC transporter permease n=1 Tax=Thermus islandicus TaxID=540988 RepID=UPI0003B38F56|nr:ABC transporter permease subunit [Thermus islandicus]
MRPVVLLPRPNRYDLLAGLVAVALLGGFLLASREAVGPYRPVPISIDPVHLPEYTLRTAFRMELGLLLSTLFALGYAPLAAKTRLEPFLVALLDLLQSVPVLGFVAASLGALSTLFPGKALGYELASVFAVFTSQAWNMAFSFYQSLKTLPRELDEAARLYHLRPLQRFLRLELPFALPGLVWNAMLSMSGGWFFVVASEAISVGKTEVDLPGVGSYLARALAEENLRAMAYAILAMLLTLLLYDQLLFRPLVAWSERFKYEERPGEYPAKSWVLDLLRRTRAAKRLGEGVWEALLERALAWKGPQGVGGLRALSWTPPVFLGLLGVLGLWSLARLLLPLGVGEWLRALGLGFLTFLRVMGILLLATLLWVPVGVLLGLRPALAVRVQALIQFLAAFPANLFYPFAAYLLLRYGLSLEVFSAFLMVLGTQWYLLFNVAAGAMALPGDLLEAAKAYGLKGSLLWRRLLLPGVFPFLVTGLVTASGNAWNTSIVAEVLRWGPTRLEATGLGAYITRATEAGDEGRLLLGILVMSLWVLTVNRLLWRRLYRLAEERFRL